MLNLSENFKHEDRKCICCGKSELEWLDKPGSDYPPCDICQACYDITSRVKYSVSYLEKIILYIEDPRPAGDEE